MTHLRRLASEISDGFRAGCDLLLYGHAYPRHYAIEVPPAPPARASGR